MPLLLPLSVLALGAAGYGVKRRRGRRPARQLSSIKAEVSDSAESTGPREHDDLIAVLVHSLGEELPAIGLSTGNNVVSRLTGVLL